MTERWRFGSRWQGGFEEISVVDKASANDRVLGGTNENISSLLFIGR